MNETERSIARYLYLAKELNLTMDREDYLYTLQELLDTGDIWRYDISIINMVVRLLETGDLLQVEHIKNEVMIMLDS